MVRWAVGRAWGSGEPDTSGDEPQGGAAAAAAVGDGAAAAAAVVGDGAAAALLGEEVGEWRGGGSRCSSPALPNRAPPRAAAGRASDGSDAGAGCAAVAGDSGGAPGPFGEELLWATAAASSADGDSRTSGGSGCCCVHGWVGAEKARKCV